MTDYVADTMRECLDGGIDDSLRDLAAQDALSFERLGVRSERERNLALYLDFFLDDLVAEAGQKVADEDRHRIISTAFGILRRMEAVDLTDIRRAVFGALTMQKKAYHNTMGTMDNNKRPQRDISKWIKTLGDILSAQRMGEPRTSAVERLTSDWSTPESMDFHSWLRYYERGDHEKYGLESTAALKEERMPPAAFLREQMKGRETPKSEEVPVAPASPTPRRRGRPPKNAPKTLEERKTFIIGRLDAVRRELRQFVSAWPSHIWQQLYETLADLEQQIVSLRTASSIQDCIMRTASIWENQGIAGGASALRKIAQPGEDVVSQIEKALTGREYETAPPVPDTGTDVGADAGMAGGLPPMPDDLGQPPADAPPEGEMPGAPPAAMEELPEAPPPPSVEEKPKGKEKKRSGTDENPYSGSTVQDVLGVLEPLARTFKERDSVRQLAKVDMMMDALGIASYFPELGEAIARLIETNAAVSTRLEKIMGKLRGSAEGDEGAEQPPNIDMSSRPEETAVQVNEAPPAAKPEEAGAVAVEAPPAAAPAEETAVQVNEAPERAPGG